MWSNDYKDNPLLQRLVQAKLGNPVSDELPNPLKQPPKANFNNQGFNLHRDPAEQANKDKHAVYKAALFHALKYNKPQ